MRFSNWVVALALLVWVTAPALIYIPNVEIDPILIYQVQVACDRLESTLRATYGTMSQNDIDYYVKVFAANWFLQQLSNAQALKPYNNVVVGSNNTVSGSHSLIIGNDNMVLGTGNYVFSQNFNSAAAGATGNDLVLDEWLIKLAMLQGFTNFVAYFKNPKSYIYKW